MVVCLSFLSIFISNIRATPCTPADCSSTDVFGGATNYMAVILSNVDLAEGELDAPVLIGGNAELSIVFADNTSFPQPFSVYVNGSLHVTAFMVSNSGDVDCGGTVTGGIVFFASTGALNTNAPDPSLDITGYISYLRTLSTFWSNMTPTGTVTQSGTELIFNCNSTQNVLGYQVFSVSASLFPYGFSTDYTSCDSSQTLIINVNGTSVTLAGGIIDETSIPPSQVIYNFYSATSLEIDFTTIDGTLMAPLATLTGTSLETGQSFLNAIDADDAHFVTYSGEGQSNFFAGCAPLGCA